MPVLRDSVVPHNVIIIRDSVMFHRMPFKIYTDSLITPHRDTLIHSLDTYTGKATWKGWQSAYAVAHTDTTTLAPAPSKSSFFQSLTAYLADIGLILIGVVIGFIAKSMIKITV